MDKLLENHGKSHMERHIAEEEHEMLICHFRLGTRCVSGRRDRHYVFNGLLYFRSDTQLLRFYGLSVPLVSLDGLHGYL